MAAPPAGDVLADGVVGYIVAHWTPRIEPALKGAVVETAMLRSADPLASIARLLRRDHCPDECGEVERQLAAAEARVRELEHEVARLHTDLAASRRRASTLGGANDASPLPPPGLAPLAKQTKGALEPLRKRRIQEQKETDAIQGGARHAAKLPDALQKFKPLAEEERIVAAAKGLHELELAVARDPGSEAAVGALREALKVLGRETREVIARRTAQTDEQERMKLIKECQAAITAGNKDFQVVYDGVHEVIKGGEEAGQRMYAEAIRRLEEAEAAKGGGEAKAEQRPEAAEPATLLADAARAKPAFDVVVRAVSEAVGGQATLEAAVLGRRGKDGKEETGLKKTARVVEKSALRPGDGRGMCERVCDVVRAMIVAADMATVAAVADALLALIEAGVIEVVRIKDRFRQPSAGGWRDLMINFIVVGDEARHVCEIQVVHEMMLTARKGLPGHAIYAIVRNASELVESCGMLTEVRAQEVRAMREANATLSEMQVVAAFEDAPVLEDEGLIRVIEGGKAKLGLLIKAGEDGRLAALDLSHQKLGAAGAAVVARLLPVMGSLTTVNLSSNKLCGRWFDPNERTMRGTYSAEGIKAIADALRVTASLTAIGQGGLNGGLNVKYNQLRDEGWGAIFTSVCSNKDSKIAFIDASGESIGRPGAKLIAKALQESVAASLTKISLAMNKLQVEGTRVVCEAVKGNKTLKELDLSGESNIGGPAGAKHVADMLGVNASLTSLSLAENEFGDDGAEALSIGLKENKSLKTLDLRGKADGGGIIRPRGATALASAIAVMASLTRLDVSWNMLGVEGVNFVRDAVKGREGFVLLDANND